jgi:putative hemolysin
VDYLEMTLEVEGKENLPDPADGRLYTFVSNHPLGGEDGVALGALIGRHYDSRFRYLVNDLLMYLPGLAPLCIPINKTGKASRNFPAMVEAGFQSDNHMLMFPAGLCSRRHDGVIRDIPWKKTFISKSVEYQRDVVPIHFGGQNSSFFYRLANFSDRFLPFNLAMLYLVDEMYKNVGKTFRVAIGKPIPWQTFDKSKSPMEWAKYVQDIVYSL